MTHEKQVRYQAAAGYSTYGTPPSAGGCTDIWIIFHGYGQLAKHFIRRFDVLDPMRNYVIAPQGLSKFYLGVGYKDVGASWLTKEEREQDLANQQAYLQSVITEEFGGTFPKDVRFHLLGFSQGVATAMRWLAQSRCPVDSVILWAGKSPQEFSRADFRHLPENYKLLIVMGKEDGFYRPEMFNSETAYIGALLRTPELLLFDGGHEVPREVVIQTAAAVGAAVQAG